MASVNVYEAKTHLSRLLRRVRAGEEVIIAEAGRPVARLVPLAAGSGARVLGGDEGEVWVADDFDAPLPDDVVDAFYGALPPAAAPTPSAKKRVKQAANRRAGKTRA